MCQKVNPRSGNHRFGLDVRVGDILALSDDGLGEKVSASLRAELVAAKKGQAEAVARLAQTEQPQQVHRETVQNRGRLAFWEFRRSQGHVAFGIDCGGS